MKISRNADGSKAIELNHEESGDTSLHLQGETAITADNKVTGYRANVATVRQTGEMDFYSRPSVGGVDVALSTDGETDLETVHVTVVDNTTRTIPICPVQEMVTILYMIQNSGAKEHGTITVTKTATGLSTSTSQHADEGYFSDIKFTATNSNDSLLLNVVGSGAGLITDFKYRVNAVNTLYL